MTIAYEQINDQFEYLKKRINYLQEIANNEVQKINIDEITQKMESLNDVLNQKIKEISVKIDSAPSNIKNKKSNGVLPLYYG